MPDHDKGLEGFGSFAALGIEDLVREMIIESKIIAHLHKAGDVVKGCHVSCVVSMGIVARG